MMYSENVESGAENMGGFRKNFREKKFKGSHFTFHRHRSRYDIINYSLFDLEISTWNIVTHLKEITKSSHYTYFLMQCERIENNRYNS